MQRKSVTITEDTPAAWDVFGRETGGFVPDPMVLRAADVFVMGRSSFKDNADEVWQALERNVSGILTFFDALATRDVIPFINYWQTYSRFAIEDVLNDLAVRVDVQDPVYGKFHQSALDRLREMHVEDLPASELQHIDQELGAFQYDWHPDLGHLDLATTHVQVAQFLLGGLIFGAYAAASATDHLLQSKRARLFIYLSAPKEENLSWRYDKEQQLFDRLRQECLTSRHVRVQEYPMAPSVLPYLMIEEPRPQSSRELLDKALRFRTQDGGRAYREWLSSLRKTWSLGINVPEAEKDVEQIRTELVRRYDIYNSHSSILRSDISFDLKPGGVGAGVTLKDVPLALPEWVRRWFLENVQLRRHGKMLLRMSIAQRNYEHLVMGLKGLWEAA